MLRCEAPTGAAEVLVDLPNAALLNDASEVAIAVDDREVGIFRTAGVPPEDVRVGEDRLGLRGTTRSDEAL
jgi:hypothetical protein